MTRKEFAALQNLRSRMKTLYEHIGSEISSPMPDAERIAGEMAAWKALEQEMQKRFPILQRSVGPIQ